MLLSDSLRWYDSSKTTPIQTAYIQVLGHVIQRGHVTQGYRGYATNNDARTRAISEQTQAVFYFVLARVITIISCSSDLPSA